jgi:hypothetical protein
MQRRYEELNMTIRELSNRRDRFQLAPEATSTQKELSLREKQALVDEILRGMPIKQIELYEETGPEGTKRYMVTRGWAQLQAILDFIDGKFPTWTAVEKEQWERGQE